MQVISVPTPIVEVHAVDGNSPTFRLEQDGSSGFTPQTWDLAGNETSFFVRDATSGSTLPFRIMTGGAPSASLVIDGDGDVGVGAGTNPDSRFHVQSTDASELVGEGVVKIENSNGTSQARSMLLMLNTGRPEIVFGNTTQNREWALGGGSNLIFKVGDIGSGTGVKTKHFDLNGSTGNLEITGSITTGGGTCGGGCDLVFTPEYDLPARSEYHSAMWDQGYLPNVGPTIANAPINVSDKLGRMLNALEHAHIYTDEQARQIAALNARIEALEAGK